jgi:hypothetical protein
MYYLRRFLPVVLQKVPSMKQYQTLMLGLNSCEMRLTLH